MRSFISYFLRLKGSAGRTAAALLSVQKIERYFIKIKILKMRLRRPYVTCAKPNRQSEFNDKNENVGKETG